jgi:hypothetical protein
VKITYDPIGNAPVASFENPGDSYAGAIVKAEERQDKYGDDAIAALTLQLDAPSDDGDEYAVLFVRSKQMQRAVGKAAHRAGAEEVEVGDWIRVTFVENRECSNGEMKWYEAEYKPSAPSADGPLGSGELGETASDDLPPF